MFSFAQTLLCRVYYPVRIHVRPKIHTICDLSHGPFTHLFSIFPCLQSSKLVPSSLLASQPCYLQLPRFRIYPYLRQLFPPHRLVTVTCQNLCLERGFSPTKSFRVTIECSCESNPRLAYIGKLSQFIHVLSLGYFLFLFFSLASYGSYR